VTVVACKDGIMVADTASWSGGVKFGNAQKIARMPDGSLLGCAGWKPVIMQVREWLADGARADNKPTPADKDDLDAIILRPDGKIWSISYRFDLYPSDALMDAAGAHNEFLLGAMLAGASAEEAVRLALRHCGSAGGDIQVENLQ
jgi:hypothetical protein